MPYIHIPEVSHVTGTDLTYVLASAWLDQMAHDAGEPAWITNDFLLRLSTTDGRYIENEQGLRQTKAGEWFDPATAPKTTVWAVETVEHDPKSDILACIEAYLRRAKEAQWSGDHTGDGAKPFYVAGSPVAQKTQIISRDAVDAGGVLLSAATLAGARLAVKS